ncbi:S8 family serine peptidase [Paenibacillus enshidis]|uniref:S8 family serine peptidase n=1 Tax=Paenibacillus enshidis TaxID=1458439 RepID=A0ABV5AUX6_9BACL
MFKFRKRNKPFTVGVAILMTFSLIQPAYAETTSDRPYLSMKSDSSAAVAEPKVASKLTQQFEEDKFVTYLVKMKEQTDTAAVSEKALQRSTLTRETPSAAKLSVRSSVVSSLRETASRTQYGLEEFLQKEQAKGSVQEYKSFFIVNSMAVTSTKEVMEQIALQPEVEKILPNETRYLHAPAPGAVEVKDESAVEADTKGAAGSAEGVPAVLDEDRISAVDSAGLKTTEVDPETVEWNIAQINAPEVWEKGIDGTGIVVANMDTGVELSHPALSSKWRGYDAAGNIADAELNWFDPHSGADLPADTNGHGTHTMGSMVGAEENGQNHIGVAPGAKWIAVRIFNPSSSDAIILEGGQWLLAPVDSEGNLHPEMAPDVINNSWGGGPGIDEWFRPIVQAWRDAQIFPEFSAGNTDPSRGIEGGPGSVANPANYPESFATGATDINEDLADFSLQGPSPYGEIKPEVSAPGVNIRSSVPGGGYALNSGTSMAGPHTTALAALLLQANHSLTVDDLEEIIMDTAVPRTDSQFQDAPNNGYGYGIINALNAVSSVADELGSVSGRVITGGDDLEEPVLQHTPVAAAFKGVDISVTAQVTDNVGVTAVELYAKTSGTEHYVYVPMERAAGDSKDGTYMGTIPQFLVETAGVDYYIRVNDYGNNGFASPVYQVPVSSGVVPGYVQNFEADVQGFNSGGQNSTWAWGEPVSGPESAYSGDKVFATNLDGTYKANANAYLAAPPIDLTESSEGALLSFKQWYDLEQNTDEVTLYIASDDSDYAFEPVMSFTGSSGGWVTQYVDLQSYAGQHVYVMFNLTSDTSVQRAGWYLDDFSVQLLDDTPPSSPEGLTAEADPIGNVKLNWTAPADEDVKQYSVLRSTYDNNDYEQIGITSGLTFTDALSVGAATYYYAVAAEDYSGNLSDLSNEAEVSVQVPPTLYSESFDGPSDNGWTHSGSMDEWERGIPEFGPASAVSEPNVWGTDLDSNYENSADSSLYSPTVDLTDIDNAVVFFNHWFELETGYDHGYVEISNDDGQSWAVLGQFSDSNRGKQWSPVYYNLDEYRGSEVKFRFHVETDNSVVRAGWYIDDFRVVGALAGIEDTESVTFDRPSDKEKAADMTPLFKISVTSSTDFKQSQPKAPAEEAGGISLQSLPASATVTVLETQRSVKTDSATGRYSMLHASGDYTLKAEAYGYYPQTKQVTISNEAPTRVNFSLEEIPEGFIRGVLTNEVTGEPIAGATVTVLEDANVAPARTGADGSFALGVLEGSYTLAISAHDYFSTSFTIDVPGGETVDASAALKPFIGYPGEIAYDDGTPENAHSFNAANNAWAVRMTPETDTVQVTGASFRFWDSSWPVPGGTAFKYAVYDASGEEGSPGRLLAGPYDGTALRNGEWTTVDIPDPVIVEGDFYIVYIQTLAGLSAPGLATDENGPNALRSWYRVSGSWSPAPEDDGNYMIRAIIKNSVPVPVISTPVTDTYTNEAQLTVTGTSPADGVEIRLFNDDEPAGTAIVENKQFSLPVELHPGANALTVQASVYGGGTTDRSEPVVITLDQEAPVVAIISPEDGEQTNAGDFTVTGTVLDEHPGTVVVNGIEVVVDSDGSFSRRILLDSGENPLTVEAADLAGNTTTVTRTIVVNRSLPEIGNLSPAEDVRLTSGETVEVSFDSEPGLDASFRIELPLSVSSTDRPGTPLTETSAGHYEGSYTTPSSLVLDGGVIVITIRDRAGNETEIETPGKLYVVGAGEEEPEEPQEPGEPGEPSVNKKPVASFVLPASAARKERVQFDASASYDEDGKIVRYRWNFGDGDTASGVTAKHKFDRRGTFQVELTVTDDQGATSSTVQQITIQ